VKRFAGLVEYDGEDFSGWAAQPGLRTVEGVLSGALATVLRRPVKMSVAGRTDAGVHASGQVVSFSAETDLRPALISYKATAVLPKDVAGGGYVPSSSSAPPSASVSSSASAPASPSASPDPPTSEPAASGPWAPNPRASETRGAAPSASSPAPGGSSGAGGQDAGTTSTGAVESAAQGQYR
jgi:hypothetical protein